MNSQKTKVHFMDSRLLSATNPVSVNLIGAGGTGSNVINALSKMNHCLISLGHPGLEVRMWDDDTVTQANLGRQEFAHCEVGLHKSVVLINRINRRSGTNWKAETKKFERDALGRLPKHAPASITITCVDTAQARFEIAAILNETADTNSHHHRPRYWMDFGNSRDCGQVVLSTVGEIAQPASEKFETLGKLPFVTDEFGELLRQSGDADDTPSCSLPEALERQDLFINPTLVDFGCSILWKLFRNGMTEQRGLFLNLETLQAHPLKVD